MTDTGPLPPLAGTTPPPAKAASFFAQLRATNPWDVLPLSVFEQPVIAQNSFFNRLVIVSDPDGVRRVLVDNVGNYPKSEMENRFFTAMFGEGLLSSDGAKWRAHRRVMAPAFDPRSVAGYAPVMAQATEAFLAHWDGLGNAPHIDIAEEMKALTLRIICQTMFSADAEELVALTGQALGFTSTALDFGLLDILPIVGPRRLRKKEDAIHEEFAAMDAAIYRMIAEREQNLAAAPKDLLTRLIAAKDPEDGAGLDANEIRDEVITIFMAGHETTAVAMTWVFYILSQRPDEEARLHAELDAVLGGRAPAADDIPNLPYTRRVIEEAMRLYPPAPGISMRVAKADDEICGTRVKAGTRIMIAPWILHRHRRLWDEPERFDPDRFSPERSEGRARFAYMPFGGGPRICIGAMLAMTEATLILAAIARRYRLRLDPGQTVTLRSRITLAPLGGMKMTLERRSVP